MSGERFLRICDVCGGVDDHPRHEFLSNGLPVNQAHVEAVVANKDLTEGQKARLIRDITHTSVQQRHMDCCRQAGCPDRSCNLIGEAGGEGKTGSKLRTFLTSGAIDNVGSQLNEEV